MSKRRPRPTVCYGGALRALCVISGLLCCWRASAQMADIQIAVTGLNSGKARLLGSFAEQRFLIDSAAISPNGLAAFRRDSLYPQGLLYVLLPDNTSIPFIASEDQQFTLRTRQGALAEAMTVEGSIDNTLLYQNLRFENDFQKQYQAAAQALKAIAPGAPGYDEQKRQVDELLEARRQHLQNFVVQHPNTLFTRYKIAGQNPELRDIRKPDGAPDEQAQVARYRAEFWDNVDFSDARLLRTPVIFNKLKRYVSELTPQHPDSLIAAADALIQRVLDKPEYYQLFVNWIALQYEPAKTTVMDGEAVYVHLIKRYITHERAFWTTPAEISALQRRADEMSASLVGRPGPNVTAPDPNGQLRSLLDLKAPYLVVFMYNPDCDHCIEETPRLIDFLKNRTERDVEVFGIALDTDEAAWKAFISKMGVPWVNVFDPTNRAIYAKYYVDITPELYVLNPERIIIGKNLKAAQIAEIIARDKARRSR